MSGVRDSLNKRPVTQQDVEEYVKDERDLAPYGGAGSMMAHLKRASRQYKPTDARARLTQAERAQFAAENQEVIPTTPEEKRKILAVLDGMIARDDFKAYFQRAVTSHWSLEDAWSKKFDDECPLFDGIERDGDPRGAPEDQIIAAWVAFGRSPIFAAYLYDANDRQSARFKTASKINTILYNFMQVNLVNMTLPGSWASCFALLQNLGALPAPVPTEAQLLAADRNKPASDGQPVALKDDGTPVTYVAKNGQTIRYSQQMLEKLTSKGFEMVMGIQRRSDAELQAIEEQKRQRKRKEYRTVPVIKGYTQQQLDAMPSEQYRQLLELERTPMAMQPRTGL